MRNPNIFKNAKRWDKTTVFWAVNSVLSIACFAWNTYLNGCDKEIENMYKKAKENGGKRVMSDNEGREMEVTVIK